MAATPLADGRRLRLLVYTPPTQHDVFRINPERFAAAAARHPELSERLDVHFVVDSDSLAAALAEADILIGWRVRNDDLPRRAPRLRWIQLTGAGLEHLLPLDWLPPNVSLTNSSGAHAAKAGEFAQMALLMLNNNMPFFATNQRSARWEQRFGTGIAGKTLLIVGVGEMGGAAAGAAKRLKLNVLGIRASRRSHRAVDQMFGPEDLPRLLPEADFLLVTAPLTTATRGLIGRRELDLLRPSCGLINMGRARVVDYDALADKLERGELGGAILDVFDPEPLPADSRLWSTPNLLIVPHVSSDDAERYTPAVLDRFFGNLSRFLAGRPLRNRVDPRREY
ncbi:D-2-hydroxyacid dehydrogenase [Hypericibacter sp.]|uniref:D-2-hydroxyacid dehydrogenase n=1 Tax=Hypericibacter sp. TaxID=2705401 RepID=UPI003D6D35DE